MMATKTVKVDEFKTLSSKEWKDITKEDKISIHRDVTCIPDDEILKLYLLLKRDGSSNLDCVSHLTESLIVKVVRHFVSYLPKKYQREWLVWDDEGNKGRAAFLGSLHWARKLEAKAKEKICNESEDSELLALYKESLTW